MNNLVYQGKELDYNEPSQLYTTTFQHIYHSTGFSISGAFTEDGKDYKPKAIHACLQHNYWCFSNALTSPKDLFSYVKRTIDFKIEQYKTEQYLRNFYLGK